MAQIKYSKEIDIVHEYDVIVAGGGPSGVCAAVASARTGAKTAIVERYGILGGGLTIGHIGPIMGSTAPGTLSGEVNRMAGTIMPMSRVVHNFEQLKIKLPQWVAQSGADIFLQSQVVDVIKETDGLKGLIIMTPDGLRAIRAKVVVDATGDALVASLAGAAYEMGREEDGLVQPTSLMFTVAGVDEESVNQDAYGTVFNDWRTKDITLNEQGQLAGERGLLPKNATLVRLYKTIRRGERMVNTSQANFINGIYVEDITKAELDLRDQIEHITQFLRGNVSGFENCYVLNSSDTLGVRETRRILGEYILQEEDLLQGKKFEDVVVHNARFMLDIHGMKTGGQDNYTPVKPYDIPYRCLLPKEVDGLIVVGRGISGTHVAHSSYRVMNIVMAIGQAGGVSAALSARMDIQPRKLDYHKIQDRLMEMGVSLFDD